MSDTEESVIGEDALYESMLKCIKGVLWKDSVAGFYHRGLSRVRHLSEELREGAYKAKPPVHFRITHPKPRNIASVAFRDRVYQRSLNDNVVYPLMTNSFIYDNWACQSGKGTDAARERLKQFLRQHYRKHGADGYVLHVDLHGYYPNMRHDVAEACFQEKLPEWAYRRVETILHDQYKGDAGYDPGSQLVQIAGISVLNELDHYIKEQLHVHHYLRYMDDLILISEDAEFLERCLEKIGEKLAKLGFTFNPDKTRIYTLREGVMFLGFRFRLTETGKVLLHINPDNVKAERHKLRRLVGLAKRGERTRERVDASYEAWRNHAAKGNSWKVLHNMDEFYQSLWRESVC